MRPKNNPPQIMSHTNLGCPNNKLGVIIIFGVILLGHLLEFSEGWGMFGAQNTIHKPPMMGEGG